jgi:hypothetical protein
MWTRESLHQLVAEKFRDYLFVVVSNREPYVHSHALGEMTHKTNIMTGTKMGAGPKSGKRNSRSGTTIGGRSALVAMDLAGLDQTVWKRCERSPAARRSLPMVADQRRQSVQKESMRHGAGGVFAEPVGA